MEAYEHTRDSVLYLVDASASMAAAGVLADALAMVADAIRDSARQGSAHYDAGVVLFNVDTPQTGCQTLLGLREPSIDAMKQFIRIAADARYQAEQLRPRASGDALLSALRIAKAELNQLHTRSMRRVVIVTNADDPFGGDDQKSKIAASLTSDITNSPALIEPVLVDTDGFDVSKFWKLLHYVPPFLPRHEQEQQEQRQKEKEEEEQRQQQQQPSSRRGGSSYDSLEPIAASAFKSSKQNSHILAKSRRKYLAFRGKLCIHGLSLGVRGYNVVQPRPRVPTGRDVGLVADTESGAERRELLVPHRAAATVESGKQIDPRKDETERYFKLSSAAQEADWRVPVDDTALEELYALEATEATVFEVTSFVPAGTAQQATRSLGVSGHSAFLVPHDEHIANSVRVFASLHRSMRRKGVAAAVMLHYPRSRKHAPVRGMVYAANPAKRLFEKERALKPGPEAGLYFVPIPELDSIRFESIQLDLEQKAEVSSQLLPKLARALPSIDNVAIKHENEHGGLSEFTVKRELEDSKLGDDKAAAGAVASAVPSGLIPSLPMYGAKLVESIRALLHKFRLPTGFDPYRFSHPRTAQFAEVLEHHALNIPLEYRTLAPELEVPAEQPDPTRPRYHKIAQSSGRLLQTLRAELSSLSERLDALRPETAKPKRKAKAKEPDAEDTDSAAKRPRIGPKLLSAETMKSLYEDDNFMFLKIDDLLAVLDWLGEPAKRQKKQILADKVKELVRVRYIEA